MADGSRLAGVMKHNEPVDLETAIGLIEAEEAGLDLTVMLGDGRLARADGPLGLQGLLQRLRGHRLIMSLAAGTVREHVIPMRSDKPDMHPEVAIILDALDDRA